MSVVAVHQLLLGHLPTEAWLASDGAQRLLSDVRRRRALYAALHPTPDPSYRPLLRALLALEVAYRKAGDSDEEVGDAFEHIYWCGFLLYEICALEDVMPLWRAKHTNMDTGCGFDSQLLVGAGVDETLAFLRAHDDAEHQRAAEYVEQCLDAGDFAGIAEWRAFRLAYFAELIPTP
jgi:hypothetical protein